MHAKLAVCVCVVFTTMPIAKVQAAVPGTFFWKPRVALDLAKPTPHPQRVAKPTKENIFSGTVVLIDGYQAGMTVAAIASVVDLRDTFPHLNPTSAFYYTNMYRWALRYLSLIPEWFNNQQSSYVDTHKVWRKRFFYMDRFVPQWLRNILFFVKKEDWAREEWEWKKFVKYAEPAFGKQYRLPNRKFNNYKSFETTETCENLDITDASIKV